jgi:MFS family permease
VIEPTTSGTPLAGDALQRARRRSTRLLVASAALGSVAHIAAVTVAAIAARELLDDDALTGASTTTTIIGSALGASLLAWLMVQRGRRVGLVLGLSIAVLGAIIATWAVLQGSFPVLLLGTFFFGFGNASNQLSRYAAADMAPPDRRPWAVGLVVWAATVGAVVGPNLVPLAASISEGFGFEALAGPFMLAAAVMGAAAVLLFGWLRPDPYELADASGRIDGDVVGSGESMRRILARPTIAIAVIAMVVGQVVMVGIMTMTPLHMDDHGHGLEAVGLVISAHTLGMFALSPISGRIAGRYGRIPTILLGATVLGFSALLAIVAPPDGGAVLVLSLFLLGYGWNLGFVAGSALIGDGVEHAERTRTQGFSDTIIWGSSAVASLASGFILASLGFEALGALGLALVGFGAIAILRLRRTIRSSPTAT